MSVAELGYVDSQHVGCPGLREEIGTCRKQAGSDDI